MMDQDGTKIHRLCDPKLKEAMRQIGNICKDFDIAGHFILVSETHSETRHFFSPSWSIIIEEKNEEGMVVGLRLKTDRVKQPNTEDRKDAIEKSLHILYQVKEISKDLFSYLTGFTMRIEEKIKVDHRQRGFIGHRDIMDKEFE